MHGQNMEQIENAINKFTRAEAIYSFQLLPTEAELKKQPIKKSHRGHRVHRDEKTEYFL
jgi:hypothetical protein